MAVYQTLHLCRGTVRAVFCFFQYFFSLKCGRLSDPPPLLRAVRTVSVLRFIFAFCLFMCCVCKHDVYVHTRMPPVYVLCMQVRYVYTYAYANCVACIHARLYVHLDGKDCLCSHYSCAMYAHTICVYIRVCVTCIYMRVCICI